MQCKPTHARATNSIDRLPTAAELFQQFSEDTDAPGVGFASQYGGGQFEPSSRYYFWPSGSWSRPSGCFPPASCRPLATCLQRWANCFGAANYGPTCERACRGCCSAIWPALLPPSPLFTGRAIGYRAQAAGSDSRGISYGAFLGMGAVVALVVWN